MHSLLRSLLGFVIFVSLARAQQNITVNSTSPDIKYEGNPTSVNFCKYDSNGALVSAQPACYNVPSHCADTAFVGLGGSGVATFSFKGSAIYITSLLFTLSPTYTVTVDGKSEDVDGVRDSRPFICSPLYSKTGLDPNIEHQVRLSVKGPSPTRNQSIPNSENAYSFALVNFIYTQGGTANTSTTSSNNTSQAPTSKPTSSAQRYLFDLSLAMSTTIFLGSSVLMF